MAKAESQYNMVMNQNNNNSNNKNYYIGAGETPGVGPVYKDGDTINLMSQSGKNFAATVSTSESGRSIKVDDYEGYKESNYDPYNLIPRTGVYSEPSAVYSNLCNANASAHEFLARVDSRIGDEQGKQDHLELAERCESLQKDLMNS